MVWGNIWPNPLACSRLSVSEDDRKSERAKSGISGDLSFSLPDPTRCPLGFSVLHTWRVPGSRTPIQGSTGKGIKKKCKYKEGGGTGGKSPFSLLSEPISPFSLLFEPISSSSLKINFSFSPSSLLFPPISPSSQRYLGHFSLLPILFLPPLKRTIC